MYPAIDNTNFKIRIVILFFDTCFGNTSQIVRAYDKSERAFRMKREMVGLSFIMSNRNHFVETLTKKKIVTDCASQFPKLQMNFYYYHALFFTRLLQLGWTTTIF
jgi:hypothetical protein